MRNPLIIVSMFFLLACPGAQQKRGAGPKRVLQNYVEALRAKQYARAYDLMSSQYRERYSKADFLRGMKEGSGEVLRRLEKITEQELRAERVANLKYANGELALVHENGNWRLRSDPLSFYGQRTPAEALRSFIRAIEGRRYDVVLRFVPSRFADSITAEKLKSQWEGDKQLELVQLLKNLKDNISAPIKVRGERATMAYGQGNQVKFLKEDGAWKIEDPD
jgi:hypothetical protein